MKKESDFSLEDVYDDLENLSIGRGWLIRRLRVC
jgi:hypothetical protein